MALGQSVGTGPCVRAALWPGTPRPRHRGVRELLLGGGSTVVSCGGCTSGTSAAPCEPVRRRVAGLAGRWHVELETSGNQPFCNRGRTDSAQAGFRFSIVFQLRPSGGNLISAIARSSEAPVRVGARVPLRLPPLGPWLPGGLALSGRGGTGPRLVGWPWCSSWVRSTSSKS